MTSSLGMVRVFIDESGTPDSFIEGKNLGHDTHFTIAAVIIKEPEYRKFKAGLNGICKKYDKYLTGREIKSNYIRCSNPAWVDVDKEPPYEFYKHTEGPEMYEKFVAEVKKLMDDTDFKIISTSTNKVTAQKKYPYMNIHQTLLINLWERISIYHIVNGKPKMLILFDPTKSHYDVALKKSYENFTKTGTYYFGQERLSALKLGKLVHACDSEDSRGIQLADLVAHPIKKYIEKRKHDFFTNHIKSKLHGFVDDKKNNKRIQMGIKVSLN